MSGGQIHHIVLDVTDVQRSAEFYGQALGLPSAGRDLWADDEPSATFQLGGGAYLVLLQVPQARPDPPGMHIRLTVPEEEWPDIVDRLHRRGYQPHDDRKGGLRSVGEAGLNLTDPDGHVLELEMHGAASWTVPAAGRGKVVAGRVEDFAIGSVTRIPQGQFFLLRLAEGFLAISQVCTHQQFAVTYQPEHFRFYCPRHRRKFTRTGKHLVRFGYEDTPPLHAYALEVVDGQIVVDTDVSIPRTLEEADRLVPMCAEPCEADA